MSPLTVFLTGFDPASQLGSILWGVLVFCAIAAALWLSLRFISDRRSAGQGTGVSGSGRQLQVLDRLALSPSVSLLVVRAGSKTLLLSCGKESAELVAELPTEDRPVMDESSDTTGFWSRFRNNLLYNMGLRAEKDVLAPKQAGGQTPGAETIPPGVMEALRRIEEAQAAESGQDSAPPRPPAPTHLSNADEGSGQSHLGSIPEAPSRESLGYVEAIARMRQNARIGEPGASLAPTPQAAPTPVPPVATPEKALAPPPATEAAKPSGSFAEALSQAQNSPADTPRAGLSQPEASGTPVRSSSAPVVGDSDLDALFDKIAQRRERMSNRDRKG